MPERVIVWVQNRGDRPHLSLEWNDPHTGRRKSKSAGTCNPLDAEKRRADLEYELNHGLHKQTSGMSWERFRELFEAEHLPGLRPATATLYRQTLDHFEALCNPRSLKAVNERAVSTFAAGLRKLPVRGGREGMGPYTVYIRLRFLHSVLAWAARQKLLPAVPEFPAVKVPKRKPQPVPLESFERLFEKAAGDAQMQAFLLCGWLAGLRLAEAAALEWAPTDKAPYVDLARDRIILPAELVKADADQWVPLDPTLRQVLEALPRAGDRVFHFTDGRSGNPEGPPVSADTLGKRIARLAKRAGLKMTMKTLRRGFGCRYAAKVSAHVLQRLMRHSNIRITMDYYANIDAAVEEAVLGPGRVTRRVTEAGAGQGTERPVDVNPYPSGSGCQPGGLGCPNQCDRS